MLIRAWSAQPAYWSGLAFLEGATLMACELIGAKLVAPFFGMALFVWASVLGVTLASMAVGYYLGGLFSRRFSSPQLLFWILVNAGLLTLAVPITGAFVVRGALLLPLQLGCVVMLLCTITPPLIFMGMTSPAIIGLLSRVSQQAGRSAGNVYALSTLGGIIATFACGFVLLPTYGLRFTAIVFGAALMVPPVVSLLAYRRPWVLLYPVLATIFILVGSGSQSRTAEGFTIVRQQEGILGQLKVVDQPFYSAIAGREVRARGFMVNNASQALMSLEPPYRSIWEYHHFMESVASMYPAGSSALVLGLGAGMTVRHLRGLNLDVDVVELDGRLKSLAVDYFYLDPSQAVVVDDARHHIRRAQRKYDVVIFDLFTGEAVPFHTLTIEALDELHRILKPGAVVMINFYGFLDGSWGRGARSVYKTLIHAGFQTQMLGTHPDEHWRNIVFVASKGELDFSRIKPITRGSLRIDDLNKVFINTDGLDLEDAYVLQDDVPILDHIYTGPALFWRRGDNDYYAKRFIREDMVLFE